MTKLLQQSPNITDTPNEPEQLLHTQQPGSTNNDGELTMLDSPNSISAILERMRPLIKGNSALAVIATDQQKTELRQNNQNGSLKAIDSQPNTSQKMAEPFTNPEKAHLAKILAQVCALQKSYGRTESELRTLVDGYSYAFAGYPLQTVIDGIRKYILRNSDIPNPSDILNIIDPPPKPLSAAVYFQICKRRSEDAYVTPDEREYCKRFEAQELDKVRGSTVEMIRANNPLMITNRNDD